MTGLIRDQLNRLARTIAGLRDRVRAAVAEELGRAVSGAVREVVHAVVAGRPDIPASVRTPVDRRSDPWGDEDDDWDQAHGHWEDPDDDDDRPGVSLRMTGGHTAASAMAVGATVARWWAGRHGTWLTAAGLGLGVGLLGTVGGPVGRTAVAVVAAAVDLLATADALGTGAAWFDRF